MGEAGNKTKTARVTSTPGAHAAQRTEGRSGSGIVSLPRNSTEDQAGFLREQVSALEAENRIYREALESLQADLQSYAHSVSHDLCAPLRAIEGYARILSEDFTASLDPQGQRFLASILSNAEVLNRQLEDLLAFSRAGKLSRIIPFNPAVMIREVFEEASVLLPKTRAELQMGTLPEMTGDPDRIRQLFAHLIANALKATARSETPRDAISGRIENGARVFVVEDNGIGFDPAHADKLFQVFQKLHPPDQFPGNGIGLAVVKRIVTSHHGSVQASGETGKGARVVISLPYRPPADEAIQ